MAGRQYQFFLAKEKGHKYRPGIAMPKPTVSAEWQQKAKESYIRISEKYAAKYSVERSN